MGAAVTSAGKRWRSLLLGGAGVGVAVLATVTGTVMALVGADLSCVGPSATAQAAPPTRSAKRDIPPARLRLYQAAGRRFDLDWAFLASIGAQECGHGSCAGDNGYGCAGPMQISVRRGSPCSPGSGPTLWETYGVDANGDGRTDPDDPADAVFTAARVLRQAKGAPPAGGAYTAYREAACGYYGACGDSAAPYADEVMARAVQYGFDGRGSPEPSDPSGAEREAASGGACTASLDAGAGPLGPVRRAFAPRRLAALPSDVSAAPGMQCDARIVPNVVYLARRFGIIVTSCYAPTGHEATGEHPIGAAIDAVPRDGNWNRTQRLAEALGWKASCAASGVAPACARPPFRTVLYNGFPNHGDPLRCVPCAGGAHLHVSWSTSASSGQPENRARFGYEPASWIEVFTTGERPRQERSRRG